MSSNGTKSMANNAFYRCAGPNCGVLKGASDRWWVMWTSIEDYNAPVLYLSPWSEQLAQAEGALHVCGEFCAQKLQSHFMDNLLKNMLTRSVPKQYGPSADKSPDSNS
jgi:hypothetical protein